MDAGETLTEQLEREKRTVSFDAYDITIRQLIDMVSNHEIEIAPEYQRHFVWGVERESELIESILLGIPIPSLFMATNNDGTWEVVDGVQRLSTLLHFSGDPSLLKIIDRPLPLKLSGLNKLTSLNDCTLADLPRSVQLNFSLRPLRITTLNDKSDLDVRYELFERLNTGGVSLHPQEIRNCIFRGNIRMQLKDLSTQEDFRKVVNLKKNEQEDALYEECVLRFFAVLDNYQGFEHSVTKFLSDFAKNNNKKGVAQSELDIFAGTMKFLSNELPFGISRSRKTTPLVLYEAVSVGVALLLKDGKAPKKGILVSLLHDSTLTSLTQGGTNNRSMMIKRIQLVRDALS